MITLQKNKKRYRSVEDVIVDCFIYIAMIIVFIATVYPFYYCLIISFNNGIDASLGGIYFFPRKFSLENYEMVFKNEQMLQGFFITIARTAIGTVVGVIFTALVAYSLSHKNLMFKNFYFAILIICMYFSGGLIPYFLLLKAIGLQDKFLVYIIPGMFGIWNCILMINFFRSVPESLEESARIDGANDILVFFKIIIPVSMPIFATVALFCGVGHWNDWFTTAFFTKARALRTAAFLLKELISRANLTAIAAAGATVSSTERAGTLAAQSFTAESLRMATMIVVIIPIICVYPFLQRFFVKGVIIGSIKG